MTDIYSKEQRSKIMSRVRSNDTKPELIVRKMVHQAGYRFRLHKKDLPGKPDMVLPRYKTVVFVHGCFWHQHADCKKAKLPTTNAEFWRKKLRRNCVRDESINIKLEALGWKVITIWECTLKEGATELIAELERRKHP